MKNNNTKKDNHVKIRVSPNEKERILQNAQLLDMNISDYIRHCCLLDNSLTLEQAPIYIKTINLLNEIVETLDGNTNPKLIEDIKTKILEFYERTKNNEK